MRARFALFSPLSWPARREPRPDAINGMAVFDDVVVGERWFFVTNGSQMQLARMHLVGSENELFVRNENKARRVHGSVRGDVVAGNASCNWSLVIPDSGEISVQGFRIEDDGRFTFTVPSPILPPV